MKLRLFRFELAPVISYTIVYFSCAVLEITLEIYGRQQRVLKRFPGLVILAP